MEKTNGHGSPTPVRDIDVFSGVRNSAFVAGPVAKLPLAERASTIPRFQKPDAALTRPTDDFTWGAVTGCSERHWAEATLAAIRAKR